MSVFIKDDMLFKPYITMGGHQCIMQTERGKISVRYGGYGIISSTKEPYEVWYPTEDTPIRNQSSDDIWNYINEGIATKNLL